MNDLHLNNELIKKYSKRTDINKFVQSHFKRLIYSSSTQLIQLILKNKSTIYLNDFLKKKKSFKQYNMGKIVEVNNQYILNPDFYQSLKQELIKFLSKKNLKISDNLKGKKDENDNYVLSKDIDYEDVRRLICEEGGKVWFTYDFDKPDLKPQIPKNIETLQRCKIQVISNGVSFDYPIKYIYNCPECYSSSERLASQVASRKGKINCSGLKDYIKSDGSMGTKQCNAPLYPDMEVSDVKDAFYYTVSFDDEDDLKQSIGAVSFKKLRPGFYDSVLFKVNQPQSIGLFHIIDIKETEKNNINLPEINKKENYLFTLQKTMDNFIEQQTGMRIYGLLPIKIAFIIQTIANILNFRLNFNIQIVGDPSTGKSTILKYYGFLLNNHLHLNTNGLSISIPGLRGTREKINLMGKEHSIITTGYLGICRSITIDEAGENKELIQNLKTFLFEDSYSYDKAGSNGTFKKRTTHVNLSENLNNLHLGQYRGSIRKAYKELNDKLGEQDKIPWNEEWDLHLPIFRYTNPYLKKVIQEKRNEYQNAQIFWIDGHDYALHERFPFYFYLVSDKRDDKLISVVENNIKKTILSDNFELIKVLRTDSFNKLFQKMREYTDKNSDIYAYKKVNEILEEYGINADVRTREFYYRIVSISRIANFRDNTEETDFDLLKWFLENLNCKLDISDTAEYKINGAPHKTTEIYDTKIKKDNNFKIHSEESEFDEI